MNDQEISHELQAVRQSMSDVRKKIKEARDYSKSTQVGKTLDVCESLLRVNEELEDLIDRILNRNND